MQGRAGETWGGCSHTWFCIPQAPLKQEKLPPCPVLRDTEVMSHSGLLELSGVEMPLLLSCSSELAGNAADDLMCSSANVNTQGPRVLPAQPAPVGPLWD